MSAAQQEPVTFSPALRSGDSLADYWLKQVTIRLRREVCWLWNERDRGAPPDPSALPPIRDQLAASLDLSRYWTKKQAFFKTNETARYLSDRIAEKPPAIEAEPARGSFNWAAAALDLDDISAFILALGLSAYFDSAAGPVIAACLNDSSRTHPNLALAQKLWGEPEAVLSLANPAHPVWRYGLIQQPGGVNQPPSALDWNAPIVVAPLVANQLLWPDQPLLNVFSPITAEPAALGSGNSSVVDRYYSTAGDALRVAPILGKKGAAYGEIVQAISSSTGREIRRIGIEPVLLENASHVKSLGTLAWLRGVDLFFHSQAGVATAGEPQRPYGWLVALRSIPITLFLGIDYQGELSHIPRDLLLPVVEVPSLSYEGRVDCWTRMLGKKASGVEAAIHECSRRFRYEKETVRAISAGLAQRRKRVSAEDLLAACRAELPLDMGELAQPVVPRFAPHELILPHRQQLQFEEIYRAMRSLTEVHYGWGAARAWNESGISVLFAGPPGTGKTMAAEVLAVRLDMPMYRIDLSQVVNKYIGETEKNLKRLFDTADICDTILFFDEADALFGRRTEVRDAHDRYANLEVSYLLERMERFKGLAILATNRRKDLDDAFLRRLRHIIEFPLPELAQRKAIWKQVVPDRVDASELDFDLLAKQFQLAGGNIRSIVFNACLQTAGGTGTKNGARPRLTMNRLMVAVKREYDKMNRSVALEQFGRYASLIEGIEND